MATEETSTSTSSSQESGSEGSTGGTTKKSTTKKSAAKKSTARKGAAKKSTAKRSAPRRAGESGADRSGNDAPRASAAKRTSASEIASRAARQLHELTGRDVEGVTGLDRTDEGWTVRVEVVELRRIPDTTDVLALYEVEVDSDGDMLGYHRVRRYVRGVPGEE